MYLALIRPAITSAVSVLKLVRSGPRAWRCASYLKAIRFSTSHTGRVQPASQQEAFDLNRVLPEVYKRVQVVFSGLKHCALRDKHLWISGRHLPEAREVKGVSSLCARQDDFPISSDRLDCIVVISKRLRQPHPQRQLSARKFALCDNNLCLGSRNATL